MAREGGRRTGEAESVVTARERKTVVRGRMESGGVEAGIVSVDGGEVGCWRKWSLWSRDADAPAWRAFVDECRDREVVVGVEVDEAMRLSCG